MKWFDKSKLHTVAELRTAYKEKLKRGEIDPSTGLPIGISGKPVYDSPNHEIQGNPAHPTPKPSLWQSVKRQDS